MISCKVKGVLTQNIQVFFRTGIQSLEDLCKYMKVRFVSGMDMLNLSRAFAKIMSGAASVSPVYTTILNGGIVKSI